MNHTFTFPPNYFISRFFKKQIFVTLLFVCYSLFSYGQTVGSSSARTEKTTLEDSSATGKKPSLNYVKIEIGMHILDCPVLPVRLKNKLMTLKGINGYYVNVKTQSILFNIPEGVVTKEQISAIAVNAGFPPQDIAVFMEDKPFIE